MNDTLIDRCRVFANKHTLGNIARLGVGASKELAADVQAFVEAEVGQLIAERDEARAEVTRLKAAGEALALAAYAVVGHAGAVRMAVTEREQLRNALDAWDGAA